MPIPNFDHNNVLPPHLGNPTKEVDLSPYNSDILEFCQKFATSSDRINILKNFIRHRGLLTDIGIVNGFQWVDGSFLENIEVSEKRSPRDIDVVTFYLGVSDEDHEYIRLNVPEFWNSQVSKAKYLVDHYPVDYGYDPDVTVELARYWIQLFSHNRLGVWKGMIKLPLNTPAEDSQALEYLNSL